MKSRYFFFFAILLCGIVSNAQVLVISHLKILVDTVPFKFTGSPLTKNYTRYREIRIGCVNTGKTDLLLTGAKQSFANDTSWLKASDNVRFPAVIKPGVYATISIIYSVAAPFHQIKILSNSKTGPQVITLIDTYVEPLEIKRNMADYPAKLKEGESAKFSSTMVNAGTKTIIVDSVVFPDPTLKIITKLPLSIPPGKSEPLDLTASTTGKMNFYYGGTPVFFYHPENGFENFAKQEFSCIIVPNIILQDKDTFNFGTVKRGTIVTTTYHFINKGSFPLEPGKNKSECMSFDKNTVAPGESFSVTIKYNTAVGDSGKIVKAFPILLPPFFYTNSVYMTGAIKGSFVRIGDLLEADDRLIDFGTVSNDTCKTIKRSFKIKNNSGLPITVSNIKVADGCYAFCDKKTVIAPGEYFTIKFASSAKTTGLFDKLITISYATGDCSAGDFYYQLEIKGNIIPGQ